MKLHLLAAASLAVLAPLAAGCSNDDPNLPTGAPAVTAPPPAATDTPAATTVGRTLIEAQGFPTSPVNLLMDPGFSLLGDQEASYGSFLAFDDNYNQLSLETTLDSRSPGGFSAAVAILKADDATNKTSTPMFVLSTFAGGNGPYRAQLWVSKETIDGHPLDAKIGDNDFRASVNADSPDVVDGIDLTPVDGSKRTAGGRTWTLLRADITTPLPYGGFFVMQVGKNGGQYLVAAPEIIAKPYDDSVAKTPSTMSMSIATRGVRRALTAAEKGAMQRYKSIKPKMLPAGRTVPPAKRRLAP